MFKKTLIMMTGLLIVGFAQSEAEAVPIVTLAVSEPAPFQFQFDFTVLADANDIGLFDVEFADGTLIAFVSATGPLGWDVYPSDPWFVGDVGIVFNTALFGFEILANTVSTTFSIIADFAGSTFSGPDFLFYAPTDGFVPSILGIVQEVPEPGTMLLFGIGLMGFGLSRRRKKA